MEYKGFEIKAEVTESNYWLMDENGGLVEREDDGAQFDVTGYYIFKDGLEVHFQSMGDADTEDIRAIVDDFIKEQKAAA